MKRLINLKCRSKKCKKCIYKKESLIYDICKDCMECWEGGVNRFMKKEKIFICFCNECGETKETKNTEEFMFCPKCGHVNTGFVTKRSEENVQICKL